MTDHEWKQWSIYKVPAYIADLNRKAYRPQVVSFGPYHYGQDHVFTMENHKHRVLSEFQQRSKEHYDSFVESLRQKEGDLKASYDALNPEWREGASNESKDWFLEMMIADGCFILEILLYAMGKVQGRYADDDPIFSKRGELYVIPLIKRDMLLLENQLPMLVLNILSDFFYDTEVDGPINHLILNFWYGRRGEVEDFVRGENCLHVLDVFRKSMLMDFLQVQRNHSPRKRSMWRNEGSEEIIRQATELHEHGFHVPSERSMWRSKDSEEIIRPATELHEHGIRFEKSHTNSLLNISFYGGVLKLPKIVVDKDTESMFLNLIAFERCHVGAGNEVTSYIFFMDKIIDKGQDVALLYTSGIIKNSMESDEAAAKLFNSLATGLVLDPESSLRDVIHEVGEYCMKKWHKWRANFIHTYCRNPWVIVSLIAALLLFGLTIIQTAYTALSYYK